MEAYCLLRLLVQHHPKCLKQHLFTISRLFTAKYCQHGPWGVRQMTATCSGRILLAVTAVLWLPDESSPSLGSACAALQLGAGVGGQVVELHHTFNSSRSGAQTLKASLLIQSTLVILLSVAVPELRINLMAWSPQIVQPALATGGPGPQAHMQLMCGLIRMVGGHLAHTCPSLLRQAAEGGSNLSWSMRHGSSQDLHAHTSALDCAVPLPL